MRRHLASCSVVLATATASLGLCAGAAAATSSATNGHLVTSASGLATSSGARASAAAVPAKKPTTSTPTKTTTTKTTTTPAPPATGVKASARLILPDAFFVDRRAVIVPGRAMHLSGEVRPYLPGQRVSFKVFLGHQLIEHRTFAVKPSSNQKYGLFTTTVTAPKPGILHLQVIHARTAQMVGFTSGRGVASLNTSVGFGATGAFVRLIQQKLAAVHMYIPQSGVYDQKTGLALDAYHRLMGHGTSQNLDSTTVSELLDGEGAFKVRYPGVGKHVEGDLSNQLLALIDGNKVEAIYPISSGKPSTPTILGRFHVYLRDPGYLPDGMYYSDFFTGGYAIHGYDPAPDYPASHGCMRLPITDAISVWNWLSIGVEVDVYY